MNLLDSNHIDILKIKSVPIFLIKKYHRNGLLEKKKMKLQKILISGKWSREEHKSFVKASIKYGANWKKVNI